MSDRSNIPWYNRMAYNVHRRDAEHNLALPQGRAMLELLVQACRQDAEYRQRNEVKCQANEDVLGNLSPNLPRSPVTPEAQR